MNSNKQAAKGFKTFILTLVISLVVFSAIYYIINNKQEEKLSVAKPASEKTLNLPAHQEENTQEAALGEMDTRGEGAAEQPEEKTSVFERLANQKMDVPQRTVLAGSDTADAAATITTSSTADTTAQSTVPDTGMSGPTMGIVLTLVILAFAAYIMFVGPRNIALYNFEKDVTDDLD